MERLARSVGERLKAANALLVTAESCTGGWAAQVVTSAAGSSEWFERGFVTYSNAAKQELLGVQAETLQRHGAVSEETAREMALGALARSKGTIALAVTGVAGPGGGSPGKPVGTVCFAWADSKGLVRSEKLQLPGDRDSVRRQSVIHALEGLLKQLDAAGSRP
ncbi:MAG TPA: nicotinamide-nucleotide amidohydrolase family protein [Burkholderiales bacterium]